jgi:hypothetical protein
MDCEVASRRAPHQRRCPTCPSTMASACRTRSRHFPAFPHPVPLRSAIARAAMGVRAAPGRGSGRAMLDAEACVWTRSSRAELEEYQLIEMMQEPLAFSKEVRSRWRPLQRVSRCWAGRASGGPGPPARAAAAHAGIHDWRRVKHPSEQGALATSWSPWARGGER